MVVDKKIKVRADGGPQIGNGHWSRVQSFISSCDSVHPILFTKYPEYFAYAFSNPSFEIVAIEHEHDFFNNVHEGDVVLLDGYFFDASYFKSLKKKGAFVILIDDLLTSETTVDVILNHTPGIDASRYQKPAPYCSFYLGGDFSLISTSFIGAASIKTSERAEKILICMGGSDPGLKTQQIINEYSGQLKAYSEIHVVVGPHYSETEILKKRINKLPGFKLHQSLTRESVSELMMQCGVAILPASTMAIEYAHVGGILVSIQTADNQTLLQEGLLTKEVAVSHQEFFDLTSDQKVGLYQKLTANQKKIFDGKSALRFRKLIEESFLQCQVFLRKVKPEDVHQTFTWATDKRVRAFSFSQHHITWEEHSAWFTNRINSAECFYLIAEHDGENLGSVRFEIIGDEALISFLIDPAHFGKGLGRIVLAEGIKHLVRERTIKNIVGHVMHSNQASIKIFHRLGFFSREESGRIVFFKPILQP